MQGYDLGSSLWVEWGFNQWKHLQPKTFMNSKSGDLWKSIAKGVKFLSLELGRLLMRKLAVAITLNQ